MRNWEAPHLGNIPPLIISVALTGAVVSKSKYPSLPVRPSEISDQALQAADAGASTVHIHTRDHDNRPTHDSEQLLETISLIRKYSPELIICATTTSQGATSLADRLVPLNLPKESLPDMVSLTLGSYNTPRGINENTWSDIRAICVRMSEVGVAAELEIFEPGMVNNFRLLRKNGDIHKVAIANVLLGVEGASPATPLSLYSIVSLLPDDMEWAVAGIGRYQKPMAWAAISSGGNVRVGMEDDPRGEHPQWSNTHSVERVAKFAACFGRPLENPQGARIRLGLTNIEES